MEFLFGPKCNMERDLRVPADWQQRIESAAVTSLDVDKFRGQSSAFIPPHLCPSMYPLGLSVRCLSLARTPSSRSLALPLARFLDFLSVYVLTDGLMDSGLDRSSGQFDIVLCNVVCGPMLMLEPILTALGKQDSVLVLAGIKAYQSPQVQSPSTE